MVYGNFKNEKAGINHGVPAGCHNSSQTRKKNDKKKLFMKRYGPSK